MRAAPHLLGAVLLASSTLALQEQEGEDAKPSGYENHRPLEIEALVHGPDGERIPEATVWLAILLDDHGEEFVMKGGERKTDEEGRYAGTLHILQEPPFDRGAIELTILHGDLGAVVRTAWRDMKGRAYLPEIVLKPMRSIAFAVVSDEGTPLDDALVVAGRQRELRAVPAEADDGEEPKPGAFVLRVPELIDEALVLAPGHAPRLVALQEGQDALRVVLERSATLRIVQGENALPVEVRVAGNRYWDGEGADDDERLAACSGTSDGDVAWTRVNGGWVGARSFEPVDGVVELVGLATGTTVTVGNDALGFRTLELSPGELRVVDWR